MNFNTKETLIGLQCLGLYLETGKSTEILVKELEDLTGIRQVSNGSRIIRRDCDTSLAHSFGEKVWDHQQTKADKVLGLIEDFKKNTSDDQRLFLNDLFKQIEVTLK